MFVMCYANVEVEVEPSQLELLSLVPLSQFGNRAVLFWLVAFTSPGELESLSCDVYARGGGVRCFNH